MKNMKKTFHNILFMAAVTCGALCAVSCTQKKFHVDGTIANAKDSILYFENMGLNGPVVLDSVRLGEDGAFAFSEKATDAPEFYRLRIAGQIINVSIDSTETVNVKARYPDMASRYEVTGSDNCSRIKELTLMQMALQRQIQDIAQNLNLNSQTINDSLQKVLEAYKNKVKLNYIYKEPMKASSYFALFQTINAGDASLLIFNPRASAEDVKVYAAVATSWDTYYQRRVLDASKLKASGIIDVTLPDHHGVIRKLTDLKGKVVMLDFHVFASKQSTERIMALRELYNKYHDRGFEIYQVSLDPDEHFWKTKTAALPWISVHADADAQNDVLVNYNVRSIPTYFIIDRNNTLQKRDVQIKDLDAEIRSLL